MTMHLKDSGYPQVLVFTFYFEIGYTSVACPGISKDSLVPTAHLPEGAIGL